MEERISRLEEKVSGLEERVARMNEELKELTVQVSSLHAKLDMLMKQYEKNYSLLKWTLFAVLSILGALIGFKVAPPP